MNSSNAYRLPPINAGEVFTCQGKGLMYENIARVPIDELRELLAGGSGQTLARGRKESKKWFQAQCAHYGLPIKGFVAKLRAQLDTFVTSPTSEVPEDILKLESEKNEEYKMLSDQINTITSRARSPTPGRTRRVTINSPTPTPPPQEPSSANTTRSRTISAGSSSVAHSPTVDLETQPEPVKRGRGRPRKSEPAPMVDRTKTADASPIVPKLDKGKSAATKNNSKAIPRPDPPSQTDSVISTYSELDDEVMDALDDIEEGLELMQKDKDGDSQMTSLHSPPRPPVSLPEPRTPRRTYPATAPSPHGHSPRSTLERDVVSGTWSLRITKPTLPGDQQTTDSKGTMNLHLAEDKRSLTGEFNLLGMDGALRSRTLEGRIDGAYARLAFVGQAASNNSQSSNKVFGPSPSQSGFLRFSDGRKASDGSFTLKGALHGGSFGNVEFEGVRDGEEQPLCVSWDDFVD
ncbi:hypothetical protein RSOL_190530 [Rhizoctonia solani AG-3 Rhs1AP]|uniref:Uncharacterized protein n=1 Tax=Rhizoctonia solani AG-3 Rhs1AP TaxID=1086054 RepID=X8J626_9AGAM|nr:hypothetical protein RSOL_190530 [Rhizoctonia solani AG-3 Rhs1AP]